MDLAVGNWRCNNKIVRILSRSRSSCVERLRRSEAFSGERGRDPRLEIEIDRS